MPVREVGWQSSRGVPCLALACFAPNANTLMSLTQHPKLPRQHWPTASGMKVSPLHSMTLLVLALLQAEQKGSSHWTTSWVVAACAAHASATSKAAARPAWPAWCIAADQRKKSEAPSVARQGQEEVGLITWSAVKARAAASAARAGGRLPPTPELTQRQPFPRRQGASPDASSWLALGRAQPHHCAPVRVRGGRAGRDLGRSKRSTRFYARRCAMMIFIAACVRAIDRRTRLVSHPATAQMVGRVLGRWRRSCSRRIDCSCVTVAPSPALAGCDR